MSEEPKDAEQDAEQDADALQLVREWAAAHPLGAQFWFDQVDRGETVWLVWGATNELWALSMRGGDKDVSAAFVDDRETDRMLAAWRGAEAWR